MMKRFGVLLLVLTMVVSFAACGGKDKQDTASKDATTSKDTNEQASKSNKYVGTAEGKNGDIKLEFVVEDGTIKEVNVLENHESEFTKDIFTQLIDTIVKENTADVDVISGATLTSTAIIEAAKSALKDVELKSASKEDKEEATKVEDVTTDVVVIGAGGAGLTASIEAKDNGSDVILVEKNAFVGGNTNFATGGLNAAETKFQEEKGIEDSVELFVEDTMKGGKNKNNPDLVQVLAEKSAATVDWLTEKGADLSDVGIAGGASVPRIHRPAGGAPVGNHLVKVLEKNANEVGVDIRLSTKALEIITEDGKATGIKVEDKDGNQYNIMAKAVILATGGFGANSEKVVELRPDYEGFGTTNGPQAMGEGLDMAEKLNADFVDLKEIQAHPTVVPGKSKLITEAVRGNGAILVNREAKRFIDELETRDVVSDAELKQEKGTAFLVFDQNVRESLSAIEKYADAGLLTEAPTVKELAEKLGVDAAQLEKTVEAYNGYAKSGNDEEFARKNMQFELNKAPYYAVEVGPAIHHTMGGVKINTDAQVIDKDGNVIEGLFAAGEVTGGVHGGNRLGGNAVADITIFGRIAGKNASELAK